MFPTEKRYSFLKKNNFKKGLESFPTKKREFFFLKNHFKNSLKSSLIFFILKIKIK